MLSAELLQQSQLPRILCVDVYPFRKTQAQVEYLIFRRKASVVMPGVWQPICGKLGAGEAISAAFRTQVMKKTGVVASTFVLLDHVTTYYDQHYDAVMLVPSVGVEIQAPALLLDASLHDEFRWVAYADINDFIRFEGQKAAYAKLNGILLR